MTDKEMLLKLLKKVDYTIFQLKTNIHFKPFDKEAVICPHDIYVGFQQCHLVYSFDKDDNLLKITDNLNDYSS